MGPILKKIILLTIFMTTNTFACYYNSLREAVAEKQPLIISQIDSVIHDSLMTISESKRILGNSMFINELKINQVHKYHLRYEFVIYSPKSNCRDNQGTAEPFVSNELWFVRDGIIYGKIDKGVREIALNKFYLKMKEWSLKEQVPSLLLKFQK